MGGLCQRKAKRITVVMRITFIRPPLHGLVARAGRRHNRAWPPLDLLNCAALVREIGADAFLLDLQVDAFNDVELARMGKKSDLLFVTTSALDRWQCPHLDITGILEFIRVLPHEKTYVMGAHGTIDPGWILRETGVRGVVRSEPEGTVRDLARGRAPENTDGISYMDGNELINAPDRTPIDMKSLPLPAYDLVNLEKYSYELLGPRFVLLEATRGCSFSCTYCFKKMYGNGVRSKHPDQISSEIEFVVNQVGASSIYFFDLEFTLKQNLVKHICDFMNRFQPRVRWCCQTRPDLIDKNLVRQMAIAGCRLIHYGVESGCERILKSIHKKIDLGTIKRAITETHAAGIETACFFLVGFPGETKEEMKKTLKFAKSLNPTYASFHIATPYPETPLYASALKEKRFPRYCKTHVGPRALEWFVRRAFLAYYLRLGYLVRWMFRRESQSWIRQIRLFREYIR